MKRRIKYVIVTLVFGMALVIGCAGNGTDSLSESVPSTFVQSSEQATRSAEWQESKEYEQEQKVLEDWKAIRESNGDHYLQLRNISGDIRRMIPNWRGRSRGSEGKEATMCWEINVWRGMVSAREDTVAMFQQYYPNNALAFDELYSEMDELYGMLNDHEMLCEEKYGIIPP